MNVIRNLYYIGAIETLINNKNKTIINKDTKLYYYIEPDNNLYYNISTGLMEGRGACISLYVSLFFKEKIIKRAVFAKEGNLHHILNDYASSSKYAYISDKEEKTPSLLVPEVKTPLIYSKGTIEPITKTELENYRMELVANIRERRI